MSKQQMNGNRFKLNLKLWNDRKLSAVSHWGKSFWAFKDEKKDSAEVVAQEVEQAEMAIATLQTLQAQYNMGVTVTMDGISVCLLQAIKSVGGIGRMEKRWGEASRVEDARRRHRWDTVASPDTPRDTDHIYPERTITMEKIRQLSAEATKDAAVTREAIAKGNAVTKEMDIPDGLLIDDQ